ncbi:hypothetical protein APR04_003774 [Promicromonospora umidemergens]|uniref:Uncharacterized protein n=1 Tax=Promicromonospora umidemergens TaxID=629679 RepID=A0ABP8XGS3_9MICO|nr:hypothetical protein [Promicromonospora umidemergens]MCP2284851.1 hypothetical protein [Promicromonospora umidemergens]
MARRNPVEVDARRYALADLLTERRYRSERTAAELLTDSADSLAREAARLLVAGDIPTARRYARAHQLVAQSGARLVTRQRRAVEAKYAREAAVHGITEGTVVRTTRGNALVPAGIVCKVETVRGPALFATIDGERRVVWGSDVERVEPIQESGIGTERIDVDDTVLTPSRGIGVVEHVDTVSGVTVRVDGEQWRYNPEQLTRVSAVAPDGAAGSCRPAVAR